MQPRFVWFRNVHTRQAQSWKRTWTCHDGCFLWKPSVEASLKPLSHWRQWNRKKHHHGLQNIYLRWDHGTSISAKMYIWDGTSGLDARYQDCWPSIFNHCCLQYWSKSFLDRLSAHWSPSLEFCISLSAWNHTKVMQYSPPPRSSLGTQCYAACAHKDNPGTFL